MIAYGCCVGSWDKVRQYVEPRITGQLLTVHGASSIASAYNKIIEMARGIHDLDALVLLHDDLEIIDQNFELKVHTALSEPNVELIGVAGAIGVKSLAWWFYGVVGHQATDTTNLDFGRRSGDVAALEGSLLVLSRWTVDTLTFDERYDGFHGYDCDMSRQVRSRGRRVVVADIDTHHHTSLGWKSSQVFESWLQADKIFKEKWEL